MRWIQRYRLSTFLRSSLWLVPLSGLILAALLAPVLRWIDQATGCTLFAFGLDGARALLAMLAASMLSLLVFLLSALLIAVQVASAQLTPRAIVTFLRDRPLKFTIGLVVFTFLLSIAVLGRTEEVVLQLSTSVCVVGSLFSIGLFLFLVDHSLKALRPVSVVARVAADAAIVAEDVYPHLLAEEPDRRRSTLQSLPGAPDRTLLHAGQSAVLVAADFPWLAAAAVRAGGLIELAPRVGEFVAVGEPLFRLYGGAAGLDDDALRRALVTSTPRRSSTRRERAAWPSTPPTGRTT
jgi:uncharacterized membrane protein